MTGEGREDSFALFDSGRSVRLFAFIAQLNGRRWMPELTGWQAGSGWVRISSAKNKIRISVQQHKGMVLFLFVSENYWSTPCWRTRNFSALGAVLDSLSVSGN
jgi:hypothetical protein